MLKKYFFADWVMTSYEILSTISFWDILDAGISVESFLSIWDNLRYSQNKVCCVDSFFIFIPYHYNLTSHDV